MSTKSLEKSMPVFDSSNRVNRGSCEHKKNEKNKVKNVINFLIFFKKKGRTKSSLKYNYNKLKSTTYPTTF